MVNEKFKVTKVVDLVIRNSEQLSLYFSNFSTIFKQIYKLTEKDFKTWDKVSQIGPWKDLKTSQISPWLEFGGGASMAGQNPATLVAGSEGKEGEEQEELASYLVVCSV